jgi:hypothetical protein
MWGGQPNQAKEKHHRFPVHFLGSRAGPWRGAAFLKGKAASAAVPDLVVKK